MKTAAATAPSYFTTQAMVKGLAGKISNTPFIQGDVACGTGTNSSPLVARILVQEGSQKLNAWYEKGQIL